MPLFQETYTQPYATANGYLQVPISSTLSTLIIGNRPYTAVARGITNGDGTYTIVYADNDALIMSNVTTNIGLSGYEWQEVDDMTWRELQYCAWNKDQANMEGQAWDYQLSEMNNFNS